MQLPFSPNFTQNLILIHCSENQSLIFVTRCRIHTYSVPKLPHNWR